MIKRYYSDLERYIKPNRALVIYGARRVGKTTLINEFLDKQNKYKSLFLQGDDIRVQQILFSRNIDTIKNRIEDANLVIIDEAQKIPNIGQGLKIIVDHIKDVSLIATGSASFDLANKVGEPLTGRKTTLILFPVSQLELASTYTSKYEQSQDLEKYLIFGGYPQIITAKTVDEKIEFLLEITNSYLFRDVLEIENVQNPDFLLKLLQLLAFQIGNEVSLTELGNNLSIDYKTVNRYLYLLEKSFVIKRLGGFSRNLRKEVTKTARYYFYDNGIRNAVINNFNPLEIRNDVGMLWENFLVMERLKKQEYQKIHSNNYFWRTWDQHEIDFVEERDGKLYGFEFKWGKAKSSGARVFTDTYKQASVQIVNQENYLDFVT